MTDEKLADMHKLLAEYHRRLGKGAALDVVQQYHSDLAQRLSDEISGLLVQAPSSRALTIRRRTLRSKPR
jgi:hypothetical protein